MHQLFQGLSQRSKIVRTEQESVTTEKMKRVCRKLSQARGSVELTTNALVIAFLVVGGIVGVNMLLTDINTAANRSAGWVDYENPDDPSPR